MSVAENMPKYSFVGKVGWEHNFDSYIMSMLCVTSKHMIKYENILQAEKS